MKLIVGLGNPGAEYAETRHNIGFMAVDAIARAFNATGFAKKFQGELAEVRIGAEKVLLLKPMTYMNLSGQSVGEAARFYKIPVEDIIVFHDELDLASGKLRVKTGGGHAGHNGLKSLAAHVGEETVRVRMGIGHPGAKHLVSNYVLGKFAKADEAWITQELDAIAKAAPLLVSGELKGFQGAITTAMKALDDDKPKKTVTKAEAPASLPGLPQTGAEKKPSSPFDKLKSLLSKD